MAPIWTFREMGRGEINVDPVHDEFFKAQDLADALVREAIQNSLDARRGNNRVGVHFRFGTLAAERSQRWLAGLREHLDPVSRERSVTLPTLDGDMPYLVVEDFGTRGLTGDPHTDPELDESNDRNDFFYFWRNVGRSSKGDLDRGRWGLGKAVFSVASQIRSLFGITRRPGDEEPLLLGQSVLKTHILDGTRFDPYGFYADMRDDYPLPFGKPKVIARFCDDFDVARDEPGLSIVVPFPRAEELSFERIVATSIQQYFYPLVRGDLVVTVSDERRTEVIESQSIDQVAERYVDHGDRVQRLCALTRWSLDADEEMIVLPERDGSKAPKWDERLFASLPLEQIRQRFDAGERVAIRVPLLVKRKKARPASTWFDVFIERDAELDRGEHHFIRRGITIPEVKSATDKPVRALAVIDQEALSTFLGDAENPAHSDWMERSDKIRNQYEHGAWTLRFVKNSIAFIAAVLSRPPAGRVRDFFADVFSIEAPEEEAMEMEESEQPGHHHVRDGFADGAAPAVFPTTSPRKTALIVTRTGDGFVIRGREPASVGALIEAEIAYRLRSGNPFRKYSAWDFDLGGPAVTLDVDGATLQQKQENRFRFIPTKPDFQVAISGFDPHPDQIVRITETSEEEHAPEAELH